MRRRTIARGIYEDRYGITVRWRDGGATRQKRFPLDAPLDALKTFRKTQLRQATSSRSTGGSFTRDATRFLALRKGRPSFKSERAHLRPWIHRFGRTSRWLITREGIAGAVRAWHAQGYSPRELRHRVRVLRAFFLWTDPERQPPTNGVALPKIIRRKPQPVDAATIRTVALNLRKQEVHGIGRLRSAKTRARFLILALTGVRPIQLMRATPAHLDWTRGLWYVDPAKDDGGTVIAFNEQIRAAWELFAAARAWGRYDSRSFSKTLHRNGWPKGVRPYQTRHTVGQLLRELGADLGDIQDHLGHRSPNTTRAFYVGPSLERLRAISARLDGRVDAAALDLTQPTDTIRSEQKAKARDNPPQTAPRLRGAHARAINGKSVKSA